MDKILLVEDRPIMQQLFVDVLKNNFEPEFHIDSCTFKELASPAKLKNPGTVIFNLTTRSAESFAKVQDWINKGLLNGKRIMILSDYSMPRLKENGRMYIKYCFEDTFNEHCQDFIRGVAL